MSTGDDADFGMSDTEAALHSVLNKLTKSTACPRMAFKHQIYEVIRNKTAVMP